MNHRGVLTSNRHDWETPEWLFKQISDSYGPFTLDVCATPDNAKCAKFFTPDQNGLAQSWAGERCWMNPPYGREIEKWVAKAKYEAQDNGATVVCLIPVRSDTRWWIRHVYKDAEIRTLRGRINFVGGGSSSTFPSALCVYRPPIYTKPRDVIPHKFDDLEAEVRHMEADPSVDKHAFRLFLESPMPCGHPIACLLMCDTPPFGCCVCGNGTQP